jgi:hypothetical protein
MRRILLVLTLTACHPHRHPVPPPAGPDQSLHDAMVLVCATPARASEDPDYAGAKSDTIAKHLTDGIGNPRVVQTAEAWKTDGIDRAQLATLIKDAKLSSCALRDAL